MNQITMYSADWCGDCRRSKRLLDELGVAYDVIDVEKDPTQIEKVMEYNNGAKSIPVVVFSDGTHMTEPSDPDLRKKLEELNLI
jgi:glutaredoxin-like protein